MTYDILKYPDSRLVKSALKVTIFNQQLHQTLDALKNLMYETNGIGLAGNQTSCQLNLCVIALPDQEYEHELINPVYLEKSAEMVPFEEGCLSLEGIVPITTLRHKSVVIEAQNRLGEKFKLEADGFLSFALQHELDHLCGKLILDYLSPLKKQIILKEYSKKHNKTA